MSTLSYLSGFGNEHESEAEADVLPKRGNSPQRPSGGLYTEQLSGTAFTAPRATNKRTWMYRKRPSVRHVTNLTETTYERFVTAPDSTASATVQTKWLPDESEPGTRDWLSSVTTLTTNGSAHLQHGGAIHQYRFSSSPVASPVFANADAETLIVPHVGSLRLSTEMGRLDVAAGEISVIPAGIKFKLDTFDDLASGWISENYGQPFTLPDPGVVGLNALAMPRDFLYPVAAPEENDTPTTLVFKANGDFLTTELDHSPLDVVAWRGNYAPYKYDMRLFCPIGPVLFDHPDPSIGTVLTSPSDLPGTANLDLVVFAERWLVAEDTFRPPWFHSNTMSEFMGLVEGSYDAKPGHTSGTSTLHNQFFPHGPTPEVVAAASSRETTPEKLTSTMAFMLESRYAWLVTEYGKQTKRRDLAYPSVWDELG